MSKWVIIGEKYKKIMPERFSQTENVPEKGKELEVKAVSSEEWEEYKRLRLEALKSDPGSFIESLEEESKRSDEYWMNYLKNIETHDGPKLLAARSGDRFIGMAGYFKRNKQAAGINGLYVSKDQRGTDVSDRLMESIIEIAKKNPDIKTLELMVRKDLKQAINLYEKFGFKKAGKAKSIKMGNGEISDAYFMIKRIMEKTQDKFEE